MEDLPVPSHDILLFVYFLIDSRRPGKHWLDAISVGLEIR